GNDYKYTINACILRYQTSIYTSPVLSLSEYLCFFVFIITLTNMVGVRCCFKLLYAIVVLILLHMNNPCIGCSERERQALLALKQGGLVCAYDYDCLISYWGREAQNKDCCEWDGVHCSNQTGHVVKLELHGVQGKISPKLIELQHLEYLVLSFNNFSRSQIPDFIGSLSNLRYLDLSEANFSGLIPYQLGNLTNLHYLDLRNQDYPSRSIYAKNLYWLPNLSRLKYLDLSLVNLSDVVGWLEAVNMLPKLTNLTLAGCNLPPPVISSVSLLNSSKSLVLVDLSYNNLNSSIFQLLPGTQTNLVYLDLSENKLSGRIPETHFSKLSKLRFLDLSSNSLVLNFSFDWVPPFQLDEISLGSCKMGPYFPKWLRTQKSYYWLDISDAGISDTIPTWFWDLPNKVMYMDLSHNQIRGNLRSELAYGFLNVSWNQLEGPIPSILSNVSIADLSNNKFSGSASLLCTSTTEKSNLTYLDLSSNHVSGDLPDCWIHFQQLVFLDLSNNSLFGKIPTTMGYLFNIETLKLNNNRFVGELPSQLKNCKKLTLVDVGENKLSGLIPEWLGENLVNLAIIILRSNQFYRGIPPQLCYLTQLQILDLSINNISGSIPKCLNNWTTLAQNGYSSSSIKHSNNLYLGESSYYDWPYDDEATLTWKGARLKYRSTLGLVKSIDLSSNKLSGEIPTEITYLVGLVSLNLSRNQLTGQIPSRIGNLQELDSLDLSRNQISGRIPISISRINRIGYLDLSENNLFGKIPIGTQLQTFDSAYGGNPLLCGEPLPRTCSEEEKGPGQSVLVNEDDKDGLITQGFYISMGLGFAVGFWGVCGTLLLNRSCRYAYFNFLTFLNDWLYVKDIARGTSFCSYKCFIPFFPSSLQLKEFVLNQPEAYEIKIGDQVFRRPGDPPLEEVVEKLQNEKRRVENDSPAESNRHLKEEL
ncbi:unnamed protein product, partial [Prunus brigantina]